MEEANIPVKERKGVSAFVSLLVFSLSFLVLSFILSRIVYVLFISAEVKSTASYTIYQLFLMQATTFIGGFVSAILVLKYLDHRPFSDLGFSLKGRGKDILYGMLLAVALYAIGFSLSVALGIISVTEVQVHLEWLTGSFLFFLLVSVTEEFIVRGYILGRLLRSGMNKFLALFISSSFFASLHLMNPHIAFLPFLNLILAGLLLGAAYLYTRNLWFPISLHLFWNWLQGPVLGYEVSGNKLGEPLLKLHLLANDFLTGGSFGFEGSIICTILTMAAIAVVIKGANKNQSGNNKLK